MNRNNKIMIMAFMIILNGLIINAREEDEPLADQIRDVIQFESFRVNALIQAGFRYSFYDDDFTGLTSFQLNLDSYFPESGDNNYGMSLILQVMF